MSANGKAPAAAAAVTASSSGAPTNAWAQPLRTKGNVAGPPPGMGKGAKNSSNNGNNNASSGGSGSSGVQNALRERFIGLSLNMVGQKVVVTQTNGAVFEGVFHTFSPFANLPAAKKNKYVIKACKVIKAPQSTDNNQPHVVDQSTVIIAADKVACLTVKSMRIDTLSANNSNGNSQQKPGDAFRTDTEISGAQGGQQRDLVAAGTAWTTSGSSGTSGGGGGNSRAEALMGALGDKDTKGSRRKPFNNPNAAAGLGKGNIGEWDQFQANQELFNVKASFDENLYTTELDKSQIDNKKIAAAERLAREIENTTSTNTHIAEERGQKVEGDFDEEDRYSGVLKGKAVKITIASPDDNEEADDQKSVSSSQAPKKMNYAAAAAKADPTKKTGPPGFDPSKQAKTDDSPDAEKEEENKDESPDVEKEQKGKEAKAAEEKPAEKPADGKGEKDKAKAGKTSEKTSKSAPTADTSKKPAEKRDNGVAAKSTSMLSTKLNANAKEFTLNPTARTFTPGAPSAPSAGGQFVDPNAAMHAAQVAAGHMPGHPYMHGAPMGQPGML